MISKIKKMNILLCLGLTAVLLCSCQQEDISSLLYSGSEASTTTRSEAFEDIDSESETHTDIESTIAGESDHDHDHDYNNSHEDDHIQDETTKSSEVTGAASESEPTQTSVETECNHSFRAANCTDSQICNKCGVARGPALGHSYAGATCTTPQTCTRCGVTKAPALGHSYKAATCTTPQTCTRCGVTKAPALGHSYKAATCTTPQTCTRCGATKGSALGHNYVNINSSTLSCTGCGATKSVTPSPSDGGSYEYNSAYCTEVLRLVNEERAKQGLSSLAWSDSLAESATVRAKEIIVKFSHTRPDGTSCFTVNPKARGENIASGYNSPQAVVTAWMNSPGHRANILNSSYTTLGIGYVKSAEGGYTHYWVQLFG